ncbi:MAG: response regulator [Candidatus Omnitrophica bacterium]|nr:response regulator [Candidatus Omnitrophota bacterium]
MEAKEKEKILLVDDDEVVLGKLGNMLEHKGWKCLKAPTGEIALDAFEMNDVDVVILDINLPRIDGFEVLKKMKALKPNVPIVILTALGYEKEEVDKALNLGAAGYVGKAMPVISIVSTIKRVLGHK